MWQLRRIRLDAVGTPAARFLDLTIDLADGRGRPLDSILWLRNGGGKSTVMALLGALMRPGRNDFLSATEHRSDLGRHLEDYVLGADTAHVIAEWEDGGRRLVTGAVYEWTERVQPVDPNVSHERLVERWYTFFADGDRAELDRLPFQVAGRPVEQKAFLSAIRALPAGSEPVVAEQQTRWTQALAARGIDPDLWRTILKMNESEGGVEQQFLFADADAFVKYLLALIIDPEVPDGVAKILGQVITELAARPAVEADMRFCAEAIERLTELDGAWRTSSEAAELTRLATAEARSLRASLLAASEIAQVEELEGKTASERASAEAAAHRAASDAARDTGNEYARLAAVMREDEATERAAEIERRLAAAELERKAWQAAPSVADLSDLGERRATLMETVRAAETDAAPLAARRVKTAAAYGQGLLVLIEAAREGLAAAEQTTTEQAAVAASSRSEHAAAVGRKADLSAALSSARRAIESFETQLAEARAAGLVESGEAAAHALRRLADGDELDARREDELRADAASARASVARDREAHDLIVAARERALSDLATVSDLRAELTARRDALAGDPRLASHLPSEDADLVGMGRQIRDSLTDALRRTEAAVIEAVLDGVEDDRALVALEATGLLPPTADLGRAAEVLAAAGISAVTGWTYLAEAVGTPEGRLVAFLAAPELAAGLLVQDPADLSRARELLADAGLRPTSLVALGTSAEMAAATTPTSRFAVPPNTALFDAALASEERDRREASAERRAERRARFEAEREADRDLHGRLVRLLEDLPPERLTELEAQVARLEATVAARTGELQDLDERIASSLAAEGAAALASRELADQRRRNGLTRARLETLSATESAVAGDRHTIVSLPGQIAAAAAEVAALSNAEAAATEAGTEARLAAAAARSTLDGHGATLAGLPEFAAAPQPKLDAGWSLDVLEAAWRDADAAWTGATSGSAAASELADVERQEARRRQEIAVLEPSVRQRADELLATAEGSNPTSRSRATEKSEAAAAALNGELGAARSEKSAAAAERAAFEAERDRQRHRAVEPPSSIEDARARAAAARTEQETESRLRGEADERARAEDKRAVEALSRASAFADQANTIEAVESETPSVGHEAPFAGTVEEARTKAREVSRSLAAMRGEEIEARRKLDLVASGIVAWAGKDEWAQVKAEVRSRFRTPDVAKELGPVAANFRDQEIELRRVQLGEHLKALDEHRANVVNHGAGMVRHALKALNRFSSISKLPDGLGGWSGQRFVEVGPKTPPDERDEAVMRDRVGRAVDAIVDGNTATIGGLELLWRALREVVGPTGFRAKVLKPSPTFSPERISVDRMHKWSGGEKVTMALLLFVTVAKLRAANRGRDLVGAGALVLDNPLGKANYVLFLDLQRRVAASAGVQLVFLTGVADMKAVGLFPNVVRMRNATDAGRRRGYVQVVDRELREEEEIARVTATRVYRLIDEPTLSLT
jgi:hypothetical protein